MFIKNLKIKNFKSIKSADITLTPLTMIVGANAAGKSNLINVFRFISNIVTEGIDNAIALQGGISYLANANLPKGTPIDILFTVDLSEKWVRNTEIKEIALEIQEIKYHFIIQPNLKGQGYHIDTDILELKFKIINTSQTIKKEKNYLEANLSLLFEKKSAKSSVSYKFNVDRQDIIDEDSLKMLEKDPSAKVFTRICNENKKELLLYRIGILLPPNFYETTFIRIFDFDPKELKKASSMASMHILEENGSNIASILQSILRNKENRKKLTVLLNEFLPFINNITIENNFDKSFSYKVHENLSKKPFHANFLSDGTVSILAVVIAFYFEQLSNIIIIEEPERNIHPKLLSKILSSAEDVSSSKQVIITTHNPEFLKHSKIEYVKLIKRDKDGFSVISSPIDNETVKCFIENELGLDDLFLQDMLGE